jgi:NNP family nitrate/nitrite transporter-like MFS transporter
VLSDTRSTPGPLLLLAAVFYLNFISRILLAPLLPEIEPTLSISHGQAGTFFLCISIGYFVSLLGSGFVSAKLGHKLTIVVSMLALALSLVMVSLSPSLSLLQGSFLLLGMAAGLYLPSGIATITDQYPANRLGRAFGIHEIAPNLAFLTAPLAAAYLLPKLDWQQVFLLFAGAAAGAAIIYALIGRQTRQKGAAPELSRCRELLSRSEFWLMTVLFSMGISATHGVYSVLPMFLVSEHGMDEASANMLVGLSRSTTLVTAFFGGWLADRFGALRTIAVVLLLTGVFTLLLGLGPARLLPVLVWLQPLSAVCFFAPAFSVLSQVGSADARNIVISLAIPIAFVLGGGLIPAMITRLADIGCFTLGLVLTGGFIASGSLLICRLSTGPKNDSR